MKRPAPGGRQSLCWLMSWITGSWKVQLTSEPEPLWRKGAGRHAWCDISGGADPSWNGYVEEQDPGGRGDIRGGGPRHPSALGLGKGCAATYLSARRSRRAP